MRQGFHPYMCQTLSEKTDTWIVVIKYMVACLSIPRSYAFKYEDAKGVHAQCFLVKLCLSSYKRDMHNCLLPEVMHLNVKMRGVHMQGQAMPICGRCS